MLFMLLVNCTKVLRIVSSVRFGVVCVLVSLANQLLYDFPPVPLNGHMQLQFRSLAQNFL